MAEQSTETSPTRRDEGGGQPIAIRPLEPRGAGRRSVTAVRRWARDTFSKEQLLSGLRSLVWVAPLTVLIWIYAEREQVNMEVVQIQVEVRSGAPGQVAHLAEARDGTVRATLRGPKARAGRAAKELAAGTPVQISIGGGRQPGFHDVEIPALIEQDPRLAGLTVITCEPRLLRVSVDKLQEDVLDVRLPPEAPRLNGPPIFEPAKVRVTAPASAFAEAKGGTLYAVAELPPEMRTPGRHGPSNVRISVPALRGGDVSLRQTTVAATVDVREADERYEIPRVTITLDMTQETADAYRVSHAQKFVLNVPVYGPADKIAQLKNNELLPRPKARFEVTSADLPLPSGPDSPARKVTKKLDYALPEGITMREQDKQSITVEIAPRGASQ